jgi:hypothetical protein
MSSTARGNASSLSSWISKLVGGTLFLLLLLGPVEGGEKYREVAVSNGATIAGEAIFRGSPPGPYVIWVTKEADVFGEKVPDERMIVSRAGKIKNVLVTVEGITKGKPWPDHPPRLVNRGGRFVPHFQVLRTGTKLEMVNEDPVSHNTHAIFRGRTLFNLAQPVQGQVVRKTLKRSGLVEIVCDTHDWMNGWIAVLDHPYYAISREDGAYKITDIPAGTYTLTAWHEKLGRQQVRVTVKAGDQKRVDFGFPVK